MPLYLLLAVLCVGGAPAWVFLSAIADIVTGKTRLWPRTRAVGFFALYLACEVFGIFVAALIWVATLGGHVVGPTGYRDANAVLQRWWTTAMLRGSAWIFANKIEVEGLELARSGPLLFFVRHSSTADAVLAAALVTNPNRLLLRYVIKRELIWDPCIDIVGGRLPNVFVDRKAARGRAQIDAIARLGKDLDARSAVLIYPEGTRFSREKLVRSIEALGKRNDEKLAAIAAGFRYVLPPRLGGPLALLNAAPGVDLVLLEHTGFEGAATFTQFWSGGLVGRTIRVRLRRFTPEMVPATDRDLWLFERWAEMDAWIAGWHDG
ncbi:MAG TPA: 1-acyl-sn-glycerol-3-phosphate acyltransferase [Myxococcota bacterium]|nr:1-acyl-sn-glycerol-3-phosphate acyltransferase [Myxococcota bacterium]